MELLHYFQIIKRRIWVIVITTIVALLVAFAGRSIIPSSVKVTSTLRFTPPANANFAYTERIMNTFIQIAESKPIIDEVRDQMGIAPDREVDIDVRIIPNSELVEITVRDPDPVFAQRLANTYTQVILDARPISDVRVRVIEPASPPDPPSMFEQVFLYFLTGIVGLVGGVGLAFLFENLDTGLRTFDGIEETTGLRVLGEIPQFRGKSESKFILDSFPYNDSFLRLRTNILSRDELPKKFILAFTSAVPEDGKSTIVANIGRSFGIAGFKTVIVDTDMIQSSIHYFYDLDNDVGLSSFLTGEKNLKQIIDKTDYQNVDVITSGPTHVHTADLLRSEEMSKLLNGLKRNYDLIIVDTPAILSVADGLMVVPQVDGVVVVSNFHSTNKADMASCVHQMENAHANLIGVIINRAKNPEAQKYYAYYQRDQKPRRGLGAGRKPLSEQVSTPSRPEGKRKPDVEIPVNQQPVEIEDPSRQETPVEIDDLKIDKRSEAPRSNGNHRAKDKSEERAGVEGDFEEDQQANIVAAMPTEDILHADQDKKNVLFNGVEVFNNITLHGPLNISTFFGSKVSGKIIARKRWQKLAKTFIDDDLG